MQQNGGVNTKETWMAVFHVFMVDVALRHGFTGER